MMHSIRSYGIAALVIACSTCHPLIGADSPGLHAGLQVHAATRLDWVFTLANQSPAQPPAWLADYDSTRQTYDLYVPKGLKPKQSSGLILFISASDRPAGLEACRAVCDAKGLLFVSPHRAGNSTNMRERIRIVLDVLDDLRRRFNVDPDRTYLAGFSGGGRVACQIAFALPEYFGGVIPICAAGELREEAWLRQRAIERLSVAHLTGETDFNRGEVERFRGAMLADVGLRSKVWVVPKLGHAIPAASNLTEAVTWLDAAAKDRKAFSEKYPASRAAVADAPSRDEQAAALFAEGESRLQDKATLYSGLMQLKGVMERWPDLPAAKRARERLLAQENSPDQSWQQEDIAQQRKFLIARARGLTSYASGPIDKQYLAQRPQMAQAALELWKLVIEDGQDAAAVSEAKRRLPELEKLADGKP